MDGKVQAVNRYSTSVVRNRTLRFIERSAAAGKPWFAYVAPYAPHRPNTPAKRHARTAVPAWGGRPSMTETDRTDKPPYVQASQHTAAEGQAARQKQLRSLLAVDEAVNSIREKLVQLGQLNNTLVIYVGDNGRLWGDHGRMAKGVPYAPAHEVPFYLSWPAGGYGAGTTDSRLVANIDIAPTILHAAGITPTTPQDGRSLLTPFTRDRLLLEWWAEGAAPGAPPSWASWLSTTRQYVEYYNLTNDVSGQPTGSGAITFREYYDLAKDPYQLDNLLYRATQTTEQSLGIADLSRQLAADRVA
jgi:arylsulfatase A-like enzyme